MGDPPTRWTAAVTSDLKVGGRYEVDMRDNEGGRHMQFGEYREIVPVSRLVFTWNCPELGVTGNQPDDATFYDVAGTVSSPDSAGVGGLQVQIVDKNIGPDVALGETTTDERGRYHLRFAAAALLLDGPPTPPCYNF